MRLLPIFGWFAVGIGSLALTGLLESGWNFQLSAPLVVLRTAYHHLVTPVLAPLVMLTAAVGGLTEPPPPWWNDALAVYTSLGGSFMMVWRGGDKAPQAALLLAYLLALPVIGLVALLTGPDTPGTVASVLIGIAGGVSVTQLSLGRSATNERRQHFLMALAAFAIPIASAILLLVDALFRTAGF